VDHLFEIDLDLPAAGARNTSDALCRQLKKAIAGGRLVPGARLPATRKAGRFFGVSRNTAAAVYEQLLSEGYVVTRRGSGTYVVKPAPKQRPRPPARAATPPYRLNSFWSSPEVAGAIGFWRDPVESHRAAPSGPSIELRPGLVDWQSFPFEVFRQLSARRLRALERTPAAFKSPQGHQGNFHLRTAITRYIALTRAVSCDPGDVLVTSGAQQGFDLLARILVTPGETVVAVEDPGYPPMRVPFAAAGARIVPVGVDAEGLIVEQLPADTRVICVCPSHQFPLGVTLSMRRRRALLEFARRHGAVVVEDDYDGEFRFEGSPLEALRTSGSADVVFYVGTFSKCMLPALRLGFVVTPAWALPALVAAKNSLDWHCSVPLQLTVASFICDGHLARHVRKMREIYRVRRKHVLAHLGQELREWLEPLPSSCGMHLAAQSRVPGDLDAVSEALLKRNIRVHALSRYYLGHPKRNGLVIGYGAAGLNEISQGLTALRALLPGASAPRSRGGHTRVRRDPVDLPRLAAVSRE
jgi:GntR family transcriptional regulator/MocR family aminotransferase